MNYMSSSSLLLSHTTLIIIKSYLCFFTVFLDAPSASSQAAGKMSLVKHGLLYGSTQPGHLTEGYGDVAHGLAPPVLYRLGVYVHLFHFVIAYQDAGHDFFMDAVMTYTKRLVSEEYDRQYRNKSNV